MHNRLSILLTLLLLLVAQSCFQKSSKVSLKLTSSFAFGGASMTAYSEGGLMVWGQGPNGQSFGRVLTDSDNLSVEIAKGTWNFYAMAWDGTGTELNSATRLRCAALTNINVNGDTSAKLELTQLQCAHPMLKGNAGSAATARIVLQTCETLSGTTPFDPLSSICSNNRGATNYFADKAPVNSLRVTLEDHTNGVPSGTGLSLCVPFIGNETGQWATPLAVDLTLPAGDTSGLNPFRLRTEFFLSNTSCTETDPTQIITQVTQGFAQSTLKRRYASDGTNHFIAVEFNDADYCGGGRATRSPFAAGSGGIGSPYLICSANQFFNMLTQAPTNSYLLAADIDLNPHSKDIVISGNLSVSKDCWEPGQNWQPLGSTMTITSVGPPIECSYSAGAYSGNFDGNNHKISNLRMRNKSALQYGFIGNWSPGVGGYFRDIEFLNPEVGGGSRVGVAVGSKTGASLASISNIHIKAMDLEGRESGGEVGGIVGYGDKLNILRSSTQGKLYSSGDSVGGIAGRLVNSEELSELRSNTRIDTTSSINSPFSIGGVVGLINSVSLAAFTKISHEGLIRTQGTNVGGLFGNVNTNLAPVDFYSNTAVSLYGWENHNFGGISGTYTGPNPARGYFSGHVIDDCTTSCQRGTFSASTTTPVDYYYLSHSMPTAPGTTALQGNQRANTDGGIHGTFPAALTTGAWVKNPKAMPRLVWEQHPCALNENVADLSAQTGRGSSANPYTVCSPMHWNQLVALTSPGAETFYQVLSPVNLVEAQYQSGVIEQNIHLRGQKGAMLFGAHMINTDTSLLFENRGKISDLDFSNINIKRTSGGASTFGLLVDNHGLIENVNIYSGSIINTGPVYGVLYENHPTGIIRNMLVDINLETPSNLYGFAHRNMYDSGFARKGLISDVRLYGQFKNTAALNSIRGFVYENEGIIKRVSIGTHFNTSVSQTEVTSFVGYNYVMGEISNIHISPHSRWNFRISGGGSRSIALNNDGAISNVLDEGEFFDTNDTTTTTYSGAFGAIPGSGTVSGVVAVPSGRRIVSLTPTDVDCGGGEVTINTPAAPFGTSYFSGSLLSTDGKSMWLKIEYPNSPAKYFALNSYIGTASLVSFFISGIDSYCSNAAKYSLIQGHSPTTALSAPYFNQANFNSYSTTLFPVAEGWNYYTDFDDLLALYAHYLGVVVQSPAPVPPSWEFEQGRMELFRFNK